jgi:hypothetical protein
MEGVDGFAAGVSVFGDDDEPAYFVHATQVAEVVDDRTVGLRLTRQVISAHRPRLKADPRVELKRSGSDWLHVRVDARDGVELLLELAAFAAEAYRPAPGVALKPPPTGADLARRRRFH